MVYFLWNVLFQFGLVTFRILFWENPNTLNVHEVRISGRVHDSQHRYHFSSETPNISPNNSRTIQIVFGKTYYFGRSDFWEFQRCVCFWKGGARQHLKICIICCEKLEYGINIFRRNMGLHMFTILNMEVRCSKKHEMFTILNMEVSIFFEYIFFVYIFEYI